VDSFGFLEETDTAGWKQQLLDFGFGFDIDNSSITKFKLAPFVG